MTSAGPKSAFTSSRATVWVGVALVFGLAGWGWALRTGDDGHAWRALLVNFVFFTPLAAALVTWPAVVILCRGEWSKGFERLALAGVSFAPVSIVALAGLYLGRAHLFTAPVGDAARTAWLNPAFVVGRDLAMLVLFWIVAGAFVRMWPRRPRALGAGLVLAYAFVFSLIGFDLVMGLDPESYSSLFGAYFFVSGAYAAVAAWTLLALASHAPIERDQFGDLGKLIVVFSLITSYAMFSQLIVMWFENLPAEARIIVPRLRGEYAGIGAVLLAVVYLGPVVLLLGRRAKSNRAWLAAVSAAVLAGLWLERWWLVAPALKTRSGFGLAEISLAVSFAAALGLGMLAFERLAPCPTDAKESS